MSHIIRDPEFSICPIRYAIIEGVSVQGCGEGGDMCTLYKCAKFYSYLSQFHFAKKPCQIIR
jgi:hypothetical protein